MYKYISGLVFSDILAVTRIEEGNQKAMACLLDIDVAAQIVLKEGQAKLSGNEFLVTAKSRFVWITSADVQIEGTIAVFYNRGKIEKQEFFPGLDIEQALKSLEEKWGIRVGSLEAKDYGTAKVLYERTALPSSTSILVAPAITLETALRTVPVSFLEKETGKSEDHHRSMHIKVRRGI